MIQITVDTRRAVVTNKELLTTGSAGIQVQFTLSEDWAGLAKVAVFRQGDEGQKVDVVLDSSLTCVVPPEVLTLDGEVVFIGVYGHNGQGTVIIPTIWASAGVVKPGTEPATPASAEPTPAIWAQILDVAQDAEETATEAMSLVESGLQDLTELEASVEAAESSRVNAEQSRVIEENQRVDAENSRVVAENTRIANENARDDAETARAAAEQSRVTAENARDSAETARVSAEQERVAAEQYREEKYAEYVETVSGYADDASASATAAAGSASNAATSASEAATSANQAASSARAAATSASQASSSASSANASASAARNSKSSAESAATAAANSARNAANSALSAHNSVTVAAESATAAQTAQSAAEDAQDAAETAAASVSASAAQIAQNTSDISDLNRQISDVEDALEANTGFADYPFEEGKYIATNGDTVNVNNPQSASGYRYALADCVEGDVFTVSGRGSTVAGLWTFVDASGNILSQSTSTSQEIDIKITAPTNSRYLVVNSNRTTVKCQKGDLLIDLVKNLEADLADTDSYIGEIKVFEQSGNIFNAKSDYLEGSYYYRSGSNLVTGTNTDYNGFIIPVAPNSRYTFVISNIILLDAEKKPIQTGGGWDYEAVTSCNSGNAVYFAVTYRLSNVPADGYAISKGGILDYGAYSSGYYAKAYTAEKSTVKRVSGAVASGGSLSVLGKTAVKDGQEVAFKGKFSSFNKITIAFSASGSTNAVAVDSTNLIIDNNRNSTITEAHGLNIANDITILLEIKKSQMFVSITSKGVTFKYNCFWNQTGGVPSECVATANGMAFSNAELSVNYSAAKRSIWYFGDSYAQFGTDTRIPYYMVEYGFDVNVLFNAVSGGTSYGANQSFNTLLSYGTPTFAIIATGMNNGSDADANTPAASWLVEEQAFIETCEMNGVMPILCTVPSVPGISHEGKNAWVRASGKRYIDFAGAVGATPAGEWYAGMLSSDNVHPSTLGGNALFTQLIADLPEVMG